MSSHRLLANRDVQFAFMDQIVVDGKANFFERTVSEYSSVRRVGGGM